VALGALAAIKQFLPLAFRILGGTGGGSGASFGKFRRMADFFRKEIFRQGIKGGLDEFQSLVNLKSSRFFRHISLPSR
jgi:hypothetical protein